VRAELWDPAAEAAMGHIELARWAELILLAPATADLIARLASGRADDLLTTLVLATDAKVALAPAMNRLMWSHPATQANIAILRHRGVEVLGPGRGEQACGETGDGRMLEPLDIVSGVERLLPTTTSAALAGKHVLITAGPTRERLDPVRYISNRSSGKMGFALADAARVAGAEVTLVAGPVNLPTPLGVNRIDVESAAQMHAAVEAAVGVADVFIGTAAVADYRPAVVAERKIKKSGERVEIVLERTPDILASVAARAQRPFVVGFAAETHDVETYARGKLESKNLDLIAANEVGDDKVFDRDDNSLVVLSRDGRTLIGPASKQEVARDLIELIASRISV
jgi:phosphopantothenoylcysteine decarboxylase/phosphopantothenate--cysteine ligase